MSEITEVLLEGYRDAADEYAQAKADHEKEENQRKVTIAMAMKTFSDMYKSAAAQEREALASDVYRDQLKRCYQATLRLEMARGRLKGSELRIELWRTEQASERYERKTYAA